MHWDNYKTEFVDRTPEQMEDGVVYVMPHFELAIHRCMCGCGEKVVTPIGENGWKWQFDGTNISLSPSVGNFQFPCRSHYFLIGGKVSWC